MDPVSEFLSNSAPLILAGIAIASFLEAFIDRVVRPAVQKTASKRDDEILEKYVDPPLKFISATLAFFSAKLGRK